jgi:hypothetical protein
MRLTRLLLLLVAAAAIAGVVVPKAQALAFEDTVCPFIPGTLIKLCPQAEVGKPYSFQVKGRNGTGCVPHVWFRTVGTLPPGLTLTSTGVFTGTPTQAGEWTFWVEMHDLRASDGGIDWCADNNSTEEQFRLVVGGGLPSLLILQRQTTLPLAQTGAAYTMQFSVSGASSASWSVSQGSLPAGLSLNSSTGQLTGTPAATGDFNFKITASNGDRSDTRSYSLAVVQPLKITATPTRAEIGVPFQLAPQTTGGRPGYTFALDGALPAGLTMDAATGAISGTPTASGPTTVTLTVRDGLGLTTATELKFTVAAQLLITRTPLKAAKVGKLYRLFLRSSGGTAPRSWTLLAGSKLPKGMRFDVRTGLLSGTPKRAGAYRVRLQVRDALGGTSSGGFVLNVKR